MEVLSAAPSPHAIMEVTHHESDAEVQAPSRQGIVGVMSSIHASRNSFPQNERSPLESLSAQLSSAFDMSKAVGALSELVATVNSQDSLIRQMMSGMSALQNQVNHLESELAATTGRPLSLKNSRKGSDVALASHTRTASQPDYALDEFGEARPLSAMSNMNAYNSYNVDDGSPLDSARIPSIHYTPRSRKSTRSNSAHGSHGQSNGTRGDNLSPDEKIAFLEQKVAEIENRMKRSELAVYGHQSANPSVLRSQTVSPYVQFRRASVMVNNGHQSDSMPGSKPGSAKTPGAGHFSGFNPDNISGTSPGSIPGSKPGSATYGLMNGSLIGVADVDTPPDTAQFTMYPNEELSGLLEQANFLPWDKSNVILEDHSVVSTDEQSQVGDLLTLPPLPVPLQSSRSGNNSRPYSAVSGNNSRSSSRPSSRNLSSAQRRVMDVRNLPSFDYQRRMKLMNELRNRGHYLLEKRKKEELAKRQYANQSLRQRIDFLATENHELKERLNAQADNIRRLNFAVREIPPSLRDIFPYLELLAHSMESHGGITVAEKQFPSLSRLISMPGRMDELCNSSSSGLGGSSDLFNSLISTMGSDNGNRDAESNSESPSSDDLMSQVVSAIKASLMAPLRLEVQQEISEYRSKFVDLAAEMFTKNDLNNMLRPGGPQGGPNLDPNHTRLQSLLQRAIENNEERQAALAERQGRGSGATALTAISGLNNEMKKEVDSAIRSNFETMLRDTGLQMSVDDLHNSHTSILIRLNRSEELTSLLQDRISHAESMREALQLEHGKLEQRRKEDMEAILVLQRRISNISVEKLIEELKGVQLALHDRPSADQIATMLSSIEDALRGHLGENVTGLRSLVHDLALRLSSKADRNDIRTLITSKLSQMESDLSTREQQLFSGALITRCLGCGQPARPAQFGSLSISNHGSSLELDDELSPTNSPANNRFLESEEVNSIISGQTGLKSLRLQHTPLQVKSTPHLIMSSSATSFVEEGNRRGTSRTGSKTVKGDPVPSPAARKARLQAHLREGVKVSLPAAEQFGVAPGYVLSPEYTSESMTATGIPLSSNHSLTLPDISRTNNTHRR